MLGNLSTCELKKRSRVLYYKNGIYNSGCAGGSVGGGNGLNWGDDPWSDRTKVAAGWRGLPQKKGADHEL